MQDGIDRAVEQIAVVADDDQGARIAREMILEPERAFEIEIVGRLVEQEQIGLGEQRRGERDAHAPAAGEFRQRALLLGVGEAEAGEDRGGARGRRMRADVGEPRLDLGDPVRVVRGLGFGEQPRALAVGRAARHRAGIRDHPALPAPGGRCASAPAFRTLAALRAEFARDHAEQRGLAAAVAAHEAGARAVWHAHRGAVEQKASGHAHRKIVDRKHASLCGRSL